MSLQLFKAVLNAVTDCLCLMSLGREFQTETAAWENEWCPNVLVFMCGMHRVLESDEEWSCLDGE